MSSPIVFSEAAREDRRTITADTVERFGIGQARRLREHFERVLKTLAENPSIGMRREELDPPDHSFRYFVVMRLFIIAYQPARSGIRVARILHGMRDLAGELKRDAGEER